MTVREFHPLDKSVQAAGVEAMTIEDIRWGRCDIKSLNLLANVLARQQAKQAHVFEAILVKEGLVTEGAVSNVMVVREGAVMTSPEGPRILSGVTRAVVLELARNEGLPIHERGISKSDCIVPTKCFSLEPQSRSGRCPVDEKPLGMDGLVQSRNDLPRALRGWSARLLLWHRGHVMVSALEVGSGPLFCLISRND